MPTSDDRLATARATIGYVMSRHPGEMTSPVPNCPGWTVYNAAVHIGRACVFWEEMMASPPDDSSARDRALATITRLPTGVDLTQLAAWAESAMAAIEAGGDRECYFSMTGGPGTFDLWAWHAAAELSVHQLDVEAALGHPHTISEPAALDSAEYACAYFMPAMRRAMHEDPGGLTVELTGHDGVVVGSTSIESHAPGRATVRGPATQVLLGLWGRPHTNVEVVGGDAAVWDNWRSLPGRSHQFGTWE